MATKYPGSQILFEIGTRADLASIYKVSERTIYRWLAKAAKESGITPELKTKYPGAKKIEKFKGTRKQLAAKYGVSERTAYRWINKARAQGAAPESRLPKSKYPGAHILLEDGTNKEIAERYNVSTRTIQRWMKKAENEVYEESITPEEINKPEEINLPEEINTPEEIKSPEEILSDLPEEKDIDPISALLLKYSNELLVDNSIFLELTNEQRYKAILVYIDYQNSMDPSQFWQPGHSNEPADPNYIVENVNIWGSEFEEWLEEQRSYGMF